MAYQFTEEQDLMRKGYQEFAEKFIKPEAAEIDKTHAFPEKTVKEMAKQGYLGLNMPEELGGTPCDALSYLLAVEEFSKVSATHGTLLSAHVSLGVYPIIRWGKDVIKKKYVPALAAGDELAAFALTEPGAGTDASAQKTVAEKHGDKYILNGSKMFITNGAYASNFIVFAMTDKSKGLKGISAFNVRKSFPGVKIGQVEDKMGICGSSTTEVFFENVEVPADHMLGEEGKGFGIAMQTLDGGRVGIAAQALGIAEGALAEAIAYSKERKQFGKPICSFQGLAWMMAEMAVKVEAARLLVYDAANAKQRAAEANYAKGTEFSKEAAMAKLFAAETAMNVTTKAVQVLGGVGYTRNFPVERMMRDAKITEIYEGTSEVQKMVISGQILR